jgi:uncharacterized protein (DUF1330 family)
MTVYVIADIKVTDDEWVPAYAASVHELVHKHGGKYLSRSGNAKTLEGKPLETTLIALLEFPSAEAVKAFANGSQIRSLCRGPSGRQREPLPADRRYRSSRNHSLFAQRMKNVNRLRSVVLICYDRQQHLGGSPCPA